MNTTVIILGIVHVKDADAPHYAPMLKQAIAEIDPDVICAELNREELDGSAVNDSRPEYPETILPLAKEKNIPIIPFLPDSATRAELEKKKGRVLKQIEDNQWMRIVWEFAGQWEDIAYTKILTALERTDAFDFLQRPEIDSLHFQSWFEVLGQFFPEYLLLWEDWNTLMHERLLDSIAQNGGKKILITVGHAHKYWLSAKLATRDDITLHTLPSYRDSN